jgi:hypothetical protein
VADTYRIGYWGNPEPDSYCQRRTQPGGAGVHAVELHASGNWVVMADSESGQITMVRIHPDTNLITLDPEVGDGG